MKILIVRHADPDYSIDSLTEKGWREAEFLSERLGTLKPVACYVSPLGRAKDTADLSLKKMGMTAKECDWLREFDPRIERPDLEEGQMSICWDWLPEHWSKEDDFFLNDQWYNHDLYQTAHVKEEYEMVCQKIDEIIKEHGYERQGRIYRAIHNNNDTIILFCHFGVECVILSHLLNIPAPTLWHSFCAAPSSVTTLATEERRKGVVSFRMLAFGDTSHLYHNQEEPAFAARFCECFENDERHD